MQRELDELDPGKGASGARGSGHDPRIQEILKARARLVAWRSAILGPFDFWFRITGTYQNWSLFNIPDTDPLSLIVEGTPDGDEWRLLYRPLDDEHAFLRSKLLFHHLTSTYFIEARWREISSSFRRFVDWWVSYWDQREAPHTPAVVRILVAAVIVVDMVQVVALHLGVLLYGSSLVGGLPDIPGRPDVPLLYHLAGRSRSTPSSGRAS